MQNNQTAKLIWVFVVTTILALQVEVNPTQAISCYCNQCDSEECKTEGLDSKCFKSVRRIQDNDTYYNEESYGCFSGLSTFQCKTSSLLFKEPSFISCCNSNNCNRHLPDPTTADDPRWFDESQINQTTRITA